MTDGDPQGTRPWLEKMRVRYAAGYDKSAFAFRANIWSYPYAIVIAPTGIVVWAGHPTKLDEEVIKKHLPGALKTPLPDWPEAVADVKELLMMGELAEAAAAMKEIAAADESLQPWVGEVDAFIRSRVEGVKALRGNGDFATAWSLANRMLLGLEGHAAEAELTTLVDAMSKDEEARPVWSAQHRLSELLATGETKKDEIKKVIAELEELRKRFPDTILAQEARCGVGFFRRMMQMGRYE